MATSTSTFDEAARAERERMNTQSGLLKLPAELRNRIYTLTLDIETPRFIVIFEKLPKTSILQASRQLRTETMPIIYGQKILIEYASRVFHCRLWLEMLSTDAVSCLRHLHFGVSGGYSRHHNKLGRISHWIGVKIDRDVDGLRYELTCNGLNDGYCPPWALRPKLKCLNEQEGCPTAERFHREVTPTLNRMKDRQGALGFEKKDLVALLKIMVDLNQRGMTEPQR